MTAVFLADSLEGVPFINLVHNISVRLPVSSCVTAMMQKEGPDLHLQPHFSGSVLRAVYYLSLSVSSKQNEIASFPNLFTMSCEWVNEKSTPFSRIEIFSKPKMQPFYFPSLTSQKKTSALLHQHGVC